MTPHCATEKQIISSFQGICGAALSCKLLTWAFRSTFFSTRLIKSTTRDINSLMNMSASLCSNHCRVLLPAEVGPWQECTTAGALLIGWYQRCRLHLPRCQPFWHFRLNQVISFPTFCWSWLVESASACFASVSIIIKQPIISSIIADYHCHRIPRL